MSKHPSIPSIQGVAPSVEKILVPTKEILEQIIGKSPNKQPIKILSGNPSIGGVVNKVNEVINRIQGDDVPIPIIATSSNDFVHSNFTGQSAGINTGDQTFVITGVISGTGTGPNLLTTASFSSVSGVGSVVLATSASLTTPNIGTATGNTLSLDGPLLASSVNTIDPTSGTGPPWKLGTIKTSSGLVISTSRYVEISIGGTNYKLVPYV